MGKVFEVDNFLTQDECNTLINYQKRHSANNIIDWSLKDHDSNWNSRIVILDKVDDKIIRKLVEVVHYKFLFFVQILIMLIMFILSLVI